jgi:hypothetical protein
MTAGSAKRAACGGRVHIGRLLYVLVVTRWSFRGRVMIDWKPISEFEAFPFTAGQVLVVYRDDGRRVGIAEFRVEECDIIIFKIDGRDYYLNDTYPKVTHFSFINMPER